MLRTLHLLRMLHVLTENHLWLCCAKYMVFSQYIVITFLVYIQARVTMANVYVYTEKIEARQMFVNRSM